MTFDELLAQIITLLQKQGRVSYGAIKRRFDLDDAYLDDLKTELIEAQQLAVDENGRLMVWAGDKVSTSPLPVSVPASPATVHKPPPLSYTPQYLTEKILTFRSALEGERKQVTVLFADIKDSTELIKDLDPEEAQKLLDPAIHIMMEAVHRFEGTVNQVLGDGIMALFGAPIAHEDHAARACYAALAMQAAMQPYADEVLHAHGITMRIRVGLNSGEVVVRTIGNDLHMDYSAVGPTTNLASRMESLAAPGRVALTAATLRLVEGLVQVHNLGPIPVKGMTEPVEVYELTGASAIRRRLQAAVVRGLTTFVGRETEIEALNQALEHAGKGQGQVVAAMGEAGVGKSRLVYEFIHSHRTQGWLVLESASVSYGKATPYFPVIDLLKRYVHVEGGDDSRTIRAKVTGQILTLDETLQETIPPLLSLVDALPEESPFVQLDPPQRRQRTLNGLKRLWLRESQVQPLLLVFEDLHWIDSETQALLDSLVESLPTARLLLLCTYRPEYNHAWGSKTYYTQLRLDLLHVESAGAFLQALLGDDPNLESLKKLLIERTEGNPFFLEESVRTLVETQVLVGESGAYRVAQESPTIQVPATVQAILAARIDRLPQEEKRLLQTAAVIGTEVPLPLLQAISEVSEEVLHRGLGHLQTAEFLYETSLYPEKVHTFKHALTHDVAYGSLLQERRRVLHARIVEVLEVFSGTRMDDQVERLAHHAFRGEVWDKALLYYRQAGAKAMGQSAYREAVACFEPALESLAQLLADPQMQARAIELRFELRNALLPLGEHQRILDHLHDAERLAEALDDDYQLGRIACYRCIHFRALGNFHRAIVEGKRALTLAVTSGDFEVQVVAQAYLGLVYHGIADYRQAMTYSRQASDSLTGDMVYERFGQLLQPALTARAILTYCHAEMGQFDAGLAIGAEAIRFAEETAQPYGLVATSCGLGKLYHSQGNLEQALPLLERSYQLCRDANILNLMPRATACLGASYALDGRITEAQPYVEQMVAYLAARKQDFAVGDILTVLGESLLCMGRVEEADVMARRLLDLAKVDAGSGHQAHALRLLAEAAAHRDSPGSKQAEAHYQQALALATELGMRPLQAHCHRGLGTLYSQTGQAEQARAELSTAVDMYREMEMTFWLPETEAALAAVEGR